VGEYMSTHYLPAGTREGEKERTEREQERQERGEREKRKGEREREGERGKPSRSFSIFTFPSLRRGDPRASE
jgi:hypothetical protein